LKLPNFIKTNSGTGIGKGGGGGREVSGGRGLGHSGEHTVQHRNKEEVIAYANASISFIKFTKLSIWRLKDGL
jgi:hypothetical protein